MTRLTIITVFLAALAFGCAHVTVDPIQLNIQHNVEISLDKRLDDFFAFQDHAATQPSTTQVSGVMQ